MNRSPPLSRPSSVATATKEHDKGTAASSPSAQSVPDTPAVSLVVGRAPGTVVVAVDGALNLDGSELLACVQTDLTEGQGNLAVAVDLGEAIVDPETVTVFANAAERASERGARFILEKPPIETQEALRAGGYGDLVEVLPRA